MLLYQFKDNASAFIALVCASYLCEGGHLSIFPAGAARIFGMASGPSVVTLLMTGKPFAGFLGYFLAKKQTVQNVIKIGTIFSFVNLLILHKFDDTEILIYDIIEEEEEEVSR